MNAGLTAWFLIPFFIAITVIGVVGVVRRHSSAVELATFLAFLCLVGQCWAVHP